MIRCYRVLSSHKFILANNFFVGEIERLWKKRTLYSSMELTEYQLYRCYNILTSHQFDKFKGPLSQFDVHFRWA